MHSEPLTESYFYILLCLYNGPNHGYGIMQQTKDMTMNAVTIGAGTMYGATSNMMKKGWITEHEKTDTGERGKRFYTLTDSGRIVLEGELDRLRNLIKNAELIISQKGTSGGINE